LEAAEIKDPAEKREQKHYRPNQFPQEPCTSMDNPETQDERNADPEIEPDDKSSNGVMLA